MTNNLKTRRHLTGDRNQCAGCGEFFNSSYAFSKHRVGEHGVNRRCLTEQEMLNKGMVKNNSDFWVTELMPDNVVAYVISED